REHLDATARHLLDLEAGVEEARAGQLWATVFREMHSLKGAARAMNLEPIEQVAHRLETIFGRVRDGQLAATPSFFDLAYRALDALGAMVQQAGAHLAVDGAAVADLLARLDAAQDQPEVAEAPATTSAVPPEAPAAAPSSGGPAAPSPPSPPSSAPVSPAPIVSVPPPPVPALAEESVRVSTSKLEALMAQMGELQVARLGAEQRALELRGLLDDLEAWEAEYRGRPVAASGGRPAAAADLAVAELAWTRLREVSGRLRGLQRRYEADQRRLTQVMAGLQDDVRRLRMLPINTLFATFPRMVRDMARDLGKSAQLVIEGGDTEVDRSVLEQIKDPLTHLLRNALDHGIEPPAVRAAAGKPATGVITLSAAQHGDSIIISVADDGQGIDPVRVRESAVRRGIIPAEEAQAMSDQDALWLIFRSGVSTSAVVTDVSGRGVGMDVVRDKVERLHGLIDVRSTPGSGTTFTLTLPLTVATTLCLLVQAAGQSFAVPITNVIRIVRLKPDSIGYAEGRAVIRPEG
ncbi:MAG: chemotaxis protein CheA, partial [Anaerolineae bacterium]